MSRHVQRARRALDAWPSVQTDLHGGATDRVVDRVADDGVARIWCPHCGAGRGQRCVSGRGGVGPMHAARRRRRDDLYLLLGCEWCGVAWPDTIEAEPTAGRAVTLGVGVACVDGHVHGACWDCEAVARGAFPIRTSTSGAPPRCPHTVAARMLVVLQRTGVPTPEAP